MTLIEQVARAIHGRYFAHRWEDENEVGRDCMMGAAAEAVATVMSFKTDNDVYVNGRYIKAGETTVVDVVDLAVYAATHTPQHIRLTSTFDTEEYKTLRVGRPYNADCVYNCARCGANHKNLLFKPLARAVDQWKWWTACPATNEPILLAADDEVE